MLVILILFLVEAASADLSPEKASFQYEPVEFLYDCSSEIWKRFDAVSCRNHSLQGDTFLDFMHLHSFASRSYNLSGNSPVDEV
jgi:hypothetical protein